MDRLTAYPESCENHYVDLFTDELDRVWIGVHFGSRGLGHKTATWFLKTATWFLKTAGAKDGMDVALVLIGHCWGWCGKLQSQ